MASFPLKLVLLLCFAFTTSSISQEKLITKAISIFSPWNSFLTSKSSSNPAATIIGAFGSLVPIGDIIKSCIDTKLCDKIEQRFVRADDYLHVGLAPEFGTLTSDSVKLMDRNLRLIIVGTTVLVSTFLSKDSGMDATVSLMMKNPLIEPMGEPVTRRDTLVKESTSWFQFRESTQQAVVNEVHSWFIELIDDEDILRSTKMDIDVMARIVAHTGVSVTDFWSAISAEKYMEKDLVDVSVLRYPDMEHPYFKLYRIHLKAWADARRTAGHTKDSNGITGELNVRKFQPRDFVLNFINDELAAIMDQEAEHIWDS